MHRNETVSRVNRNEMCIGTRHLSKYIKKLIYFYYRNLLKICRNSEKNFSIKLRILKKLDKGETAKNETSLVPMDI